MNQTQDILDKRIQQDYQYGFITDIEQDTLPPGLNEEVIRHISQKKNEPEWLLKWRLKSYEVWQKMAEPSWANIKYPTVDFQDIIYYAAPKKKKELKP